MSENKLKKCVDCNKEYLATTEYFYKKGERLQVRCKKCDNIKRKNNMQKEKERVRKSTTVLTEKKEQVFRKKAEEFNMSVVDFIKLIILKEESEVLVKVDPKCFSNFNYQIMGIFNNVNQIAHICNTTKSVNEIEIENLRNEFKKIRECQRKLEEEFNMIDTSIKYAYEVLTFDDI